MIRKFILLLLLLTGLSSYAAENYLNSVIIEKKDESYNVVLRSDDVVKVKKRVETPNRIELKLKNITQSPDLNTLYKNTSEVNALVIQNDGSNGLALYIDAPSISKADIVFETPNSTPRKVNNIISNEQVLLYIFMMMLFLIMLRASQVNSAPAQKDINEIIKEREIALYRDFKREIASIPSINYKLKSYRKHVLKGETIRSYEKLYR